MDFASGFWFSELSGWSLAPKLIPFSLIYAGSLSFCLLDCCWWDFGIWVFADRRFLFWELMSLASCGEFEEDKVAIRNRFGYAS